MSSPTLRSALYSACPRRLRPYWDRVEASDVGARLARGAFWSLAGAVVSRGLTFLASIAVARLLGKEGFGQLGLLRSTVELLGLFVGYSLGLTLTKHVAEFRKTDPLRAGRTIAVASMAAVVGAALAAATLFASAPWLAERAFRAPELTGLLRFGCLLLTFSVLNGVQNGALAGFESFKAIAQANFAAGLCSFPLLTAGAALGGVEGAVIALTASFGVNAWLNHRALRREAAAAGVPLTPPGFLREWPALWQFSLPATLCSVSFALAHWAAHALLAGQPHGFGELGTLGAALCVQTMLVFVVGAISSPLQAMIADGQIGDHQRLRRVNVLVSWGGGFAAAFPLICFPEAAGLVFGPQYSGPVFARTLVALLTATCIMLSKQGLSRALIAANLLWWGALGNAAWSALLLAGAVALLAWGALGLALAQLGAYALTTVVSLAWYAAKGMIPPRTLLSREAALAWAALGLAALLTLVEAPLAWRAVYFPFGAAVLAHCFHRLRT